MPNGGNPSAPAVSVPGLLFQQECVNRKTASNEFSPYERTKPETRDPKPESLPTQFTTLASTASVSSIG
jgi:hypothetical protein